MSHVARLFALYPDIHLFPIRPRGKEPLSGYKWKDTKLTHAEAVHWEEQNHKLGLIPWSIGCAVIDVDAWEGEDLGEYTRTRRASYATPSGGYHIFYDISHPIDQYHWKNAQGHGETRCKDGYVVVHDIASLAQHLEKHTAKPVEVAVLKAAFPLPERQPPQPPPNGHDASKHTLSLIHI